MTGAAQIASPLTGFAVPPSEATAETGAQTLISNLADGQVLVYRAGSNTWVNAFTTISATTSVTSSTATYTVVPTDEVIFVSTGAVNITINLPASGGSAGRRLLVIKTDSGAGTVTVVPAGADTIEGMGSVLINAQYSKVGVIADGKGTWYDLGIEGV